MERYEVRFVVRKADGTIDHAWSATYMAESYGHAEEQAIDTLRSNNDTDSKIERIELW